MPINPVEPLLPTAVPALTPQEKVAPTAAEQAAQGLTNLVKDAVDPFSPPAEPAPQPSASSLSDLLGGELAARVNTRLATNLPPELQQELAALLALLPAVVEHLGDAELDLLRAAASGLVADSPNLEFSRGLRRELETAIKQKMAVFRIPNLASRSPSALVVVGLGLFAYVMLPLIILFFGWWMDRGEGNSRMTMLSFPSIHVLLVCVAGAMGSVTSIMIRVQDFEEPKHGGPVDLILFGFFKPFIGMFFGLFCYTAFQSGLVPAVTIPADKENYFHFALCFIAGFSERFARDLASKTEPVLQNGSGPASDKV